LTHQSGAAIWQCIDITGHSTYYLFGINNALNIAKRSAQQPLEQPPANSLEQNSE
jgi:hypothetical protein